MVQLTENDFISVGKLLDIYSFKAFCVTYIDLEKMRRRLKTVLEQQFLILLFIDLCLSKVNIILFYKLLTGLLILFF